LSRSEGTLKIISSTSLWEETVLHSLSIFFLFSYEAEFIQNIVKGKLITMANAFNLTFMYIDDVQSLIIQALLIGFHIVKIPKII
jgi:hypothetical protein